jgi:hypothetical protein
MLTGGKAVLDLFSGRLKTHTKHLTTVAATLLAVSLNIVLQKAPVSKDQGFFIFFNQFEIGGLSSIRIMLAAGLFFLFYTQFVHVHDFLDVKHLLWIVYYCIVVKC